MLKKVDKMKTKKEDEKEKNLYKSVIVALLGIILLMAAGSIFVSYRLNQANLATAQAHNQIINLTHNLTQANLAITNLTHSLAQANATAQALRSNLSQAQATINMQKVQITNLTKLVDLNISEILYNNYITIPPIQNITLCGAYGCYPYYQAGNFSISLNISHAGYLVFNTTNPMEVFIIVEEQYNSTYNIPMNVKYLDLSTNRMVYATFSDTFLNASIKSQAIPVLPGQVKVLIYNYNSTPFYGYLNIKYVN